MKFLHLVHACCFGAQYLLFSNAQTFTYTSENAQGSHVVKTGVADNPLPTVRYYCQNLEGICTNILTSGQALTQVSVYRYQALLTYDPDGKAARSRRGSSQVCGEQRRAICAWEGACDARFPNDVNEWYTSCDEFPFASTVEGGGNYLVNGVLKLGASTKCVPAREQSQQGALQAKLGFLQSPTSTTTYKRDGKLHKFILELDYAFYAFADPTLALRLYGQVFSGAARTTYPPFESAPDSRPGSPGTQYVYTLFAANPRPIPPANPPALPSGQWSQGRRKYNCPKPATCPARTVIEDDDDSFDIDSLTNLTRSMSLQQKRYDESVNAAACPTPTEVGSEPAAATAAASELAGIEDAVAFLSEVAADAATIAAAAALVNQLKSTLQSATAFASSQLSADIFDASLNSAWDALDTFWAFLAYNGTDDTNENAADTMQQIADAGDNTILQLQNVQDVSNGLPLVDNGMLNGTSPAVASSTTPITAPATLSDGPKTTFSAQTPTEVPPTSIPTSVITTTKPTSTNFWEQLQQDAHADLVDLYNANAPHVSTTTCADTVKRTAMPRPHVERRLEPSNPTQPGLIAAVVQQSQNIAFKPSHPSPSLGTHEVTSLASDDTCFECTGTNNLAQCFLAIYVAAAELSYEYWTAGNSSGFASNAGPLAQDLNMYESYVLAAFPGNSTATREYSNAASDWETLSNDQSTSRFFP